MLEADTTTQEQSMELYNSAFVKYAELENLILSNLTNIQWAKTKFRLKSMWYFIASIITFILGVILEEPIKSIFQTLVGWFR